MYIYLDRITYIGVCIYILYFKWITQIILANY